MQGFYTMVYSQKYYAQEKTPNNKLYKKQQQQQELNAYEKNWRTRKKGTGIEVVKE